jgi:hypothetical protein
MGQLFKPKLGCKTWQNYHNGKEKATFDMDRIGLKENHDPISNLQNDESITLINLQV